MIAEKKTGKEVKNAVVSVPAYFSEIQKQATKDACSIAGLNCKKIISEPLAAAMALGLNMKLEEGQVLKSIVFDLGGGTLDVSILQIDKHNTQVLAYSGNA